MISMGKVQTQSEGYENREVGTILRGVKDILSLFGYALCLCVFAYAFSVCDTCVAMQCTYAVQIHPHCSVPWFFFCSVPCCVVCLLE